MLTIFTEICRPHSSLLNSELK